MEGAENGNGNGRAKTWSVLGPILLGALNVVIGAGLITVQGTLADIRSEIKDVRISQSVLGSDVAQTRVALAKVEAQAVAAEQRASMAEVRNRETFDDIKEAVGDLRQAWEGRKR